MAIDRTKEYTELLPEPDLSHHDAAPTEPESFLRQRFGKMVGAIMNNEQDEDDSRLLSSDLLLSSQTILAAINEDEQTSSKENIIRRKIEQLEQELVEGEDLLSDQLKEHHRVILLYLKQRLGNRERLRITAVNKRSQIPRSISIQKGSSTIDTKVVAMTEDDLVKKYNLKESQLQVLQESTQELISQHTAFAQELGTVGDHLTEIAKLQQTLAEQLEWQSALGERLLDEADSTMGTVQKGNKILEKVSSDSTMRNLVVMVFMILSLILILFAILD